MGLWGAAKKQLRSVIEWKDPNPEHLFYNWSENGDEVKDASKLIIGPGQGAIFVYEGRVEGVHTEPGIIEINTDNIPFVTTLQKFMQGFQSEHKVGMYFFQTTKIVDLKWGTPAPVKYLDPKYNIPIELRSFGNFSIRLSEPENFFVNVMGKGLGISLDEVRTMLLSRLVQPMTDFFAESQLSYNDIDAQRDEISAGVKAKIGPEFAKLGFELLDFRVSGTSFDEETKRRIGRIADLTAEAAAAQAAGVNFAQLQQLDAMKTAAANEGGVAGMGVGMGAGLGLGQMMAGGMMNQQQPQQQQPQQQPQAAAAPDPMETLKKLKQMLDNELISQDEYDAKKKEILSKL